MRKLPYLLVLLLLSLLLLAAAASAHGSSMPATPGVTKLIFQAEEDREEEEEEEESEAEADEGEETETSEVEVEVEEEGEKCLLEDATASFAVAPGALQVRLTIHYDAVEPTAVTIDSRLRGAKGSLHLGNERARFHRSGTFRDSFALGARQMPKALAAREFEVDLHAVGAPANCALQLASRAPHRAR
ncbi:MAG TPA: hypothetical protein VFK14_02970 [Solirubrobacterales bacterium]|nr:hypothetical protein [Solirubrobacterales bacterium]